MDNKDNWHLDIPQLIELVGRKPHDVEVHNKHVVCHFQGPTATVGEVTSLGADIRVRFKQW